MKTYILARTWLWAWFGRRALRVGKRAAALAGAVAMSAGLIIAIPHAAFAGTGSSQFCSDGAGNDDLPLTVTDPITVGVEVLSAPADLDAAVAVCYSTTPTGYTGSETTGGYVFLRTRKTTSPPPVWGACIPDTNTAGLSLGCTFDVTPTYSVTPGPAGSTGDTITVAVPFAVCVGQCEGASPGLLPTGVIVGTLEPIPGPGTGAAYQVTSVQVYVNGAQVYSHEGVPVGAYLNPFGQVEQNLSSSGPCVLSVCAPLAGYVEVTGQQPLLVLYLPDGTILPVTPPKQCLYANPSTACP